MKKKQVIVYAITSWLIIISIFMLLMESINLEVLFSLWLIGILITIEFFGPVFSMPRNYFRQTVFIALAIFLFGLIMFRKIQVTMNG